MTVEQAVYNIRHAQYGEEVRESIAEGIETIDQDVTDQNLEAEAWAVGTRNGEPVPPTDPAYHNNAKYHAENTDVHKDGNYPEMTVGTAEQLESTVMTEDKAPYVFRTSGGSADIGNREYDTLIGGTVAWNQILPNGNFASTDGWGIISYNNAAVSDNVLTVVKSSSASETQIYRNINTVVGHKYFATASVKASVNTEGYIRLGVPEDYQKIALTANTWGTKQYVKSVIGTTQEFNIYNFSLHEGDTLQVKNAMVIDLTLTFGTTIADHIYSLEQATPGAGVAYFRKLFPKPYYPYNAGMLIHVNASAHKTVGFNQFAGNSEDNPQYIGHYYINSADNYAKGANNNYNCFRIPVLPNTAYYMKREDGANLGTIGIVRFVNAEYGFISGSTSGYSKTGGIYTTPSNCAYIEFSIGITATTDVCINLSWSGTRNGEYEPYDAHTYPLDSDLVLRGILKLDASNNLYYDGDAYAADGTVTRRYGIVDLGTLSWTLVSQNRWTSAVSGIRNYGDSVVANIISEKYIAGSPAQVYSHAAQVSAQSGYLQIFNGSTETTPTGYLVYELATPTTESADSFASPQIVDDWGTEEYIVTEQSGVAMPVGHVTKYPQNLRDKLQHLPNLAPADGYYGIQQTGTQMVLAEPDSALSDTSKNAVQNKVVKAALTLKADKTDVATADAALEQMILASFPTDSISNVPIASFSDGADGIPIKSLVINITPVQEGSGDPSPVGKNKLNASSMITGAYIDENGVITVLENAKYSELIPVTEGSWIFDSGSDTTTGTDSQGNYRVHAYDSNGNWIEQIDMQRISGSSGYLNIVFTISSNIKFIRVSTPLAAINLQLEQGNIATPYAAYTENIRPISGWTGATITKTGNNLLDRFCEKESGYYDNDGVYHESTTGTFYTKPFIPVKANTSYVFLVPYYALISKFYFYDENKSFISRTSGTSVQTPPYFKSITTPINCAYIRFQGSDQTVWEATGSDYYNMMFSEGFVAPTYEDFGGYIQFSWQSEAGTVYGGTLTWIGENQWKISNTVRVYNLAALDWDYVSNVANPYFRVVGQSDMVYADGAVHLCNCYKYEAIGAASTMAANSDNNIIGIHANGNQIYVRDTRYTDKDFLVTFLASVSAKFIIKVSTATEYTLTIPDSDPTTLKGDNNIFTDCGDIAELTYRADVGLYIAKKLAEVTS